MALHDWGAGHSASTQFRRDIGLKRMGWLRWWCRQERRPLYRCDDYFWTHARTTLTETPGRCGRKVALFSASITKVPPGLMA